MRTPRIIRQWLWEKRMRRLLKTFKSSPIDNSFTPKRCVFLYPADDAAWEKLVQNRQNFWPGISCDFAFIGYSADTTSGQIAKPPHHRFDESMLGPAYNLPASWLANWSKAADMLLVANPEHLPALDLLAAELPAFFKVSVFATEFGDLYSFVLQSGPVKPAERMETLQAYLQKIMQI